MYTHVWGRVYRVKYRDVGTSSVSNNGVYDTALIGSIIGTHGPLYISTTINTASL
jgi:hypothetical protein